MSLSLSKGNKLFLVCLQHSHKQMCRFPTSSDFSSLCRYHMSVSAFSPVLLTLNCPRLVQTSWVNDSVLQNCLFTSDANQASSPWVTQTFLKLSCTLLLSMTFSSCSTVCCKSLQKSTEFFTLTVNYK